MITPEGLQSAGVKATWRMILVFILALGVILVTPWFTALFFLPASVFAAAAVVLLALVGFRYTGRQWNVSDPRTWAVLMAMYIALTDAWAASLAQSLQVNVVEVSALLLFVLVYDHAARLLKPAVTAFLVIGLALYVYGMGAGVNWWKATDAVYDGHQLASVFQYHNTFAAIELAIGILGYMAAMSYRRWWFNALGALSLIVSIDAVLGSQSRIAWVLLAFAVVAALVVKAVVQHSIWSAVTGVLLTAVGGGTALLTIQALSHGKAKDFLLSFAIALAASVVLAFFDRWLERQKLHWKWAVIGAVGLILIAGAVVYKLRAHLLTGAVVTRLQSINFNSISLQERFYYYKDGLKMWLNAPMFGSGGGTWTAKFQAFQTFPYWSEQTHSSFFDQLLNGGFIGLLLLFVLFAISARAILISVRRSQDRQKRLFLLSSAIAAVILLLHSLLDFDFAFGYFQYTFAILVALVAGHLHAEAPPIDAATQPSSLRPKPVQRPDRSAIAMRRGITTGAAITGVFALVAALSLGSSQVLLAQASSAQTSASTKLSLTQNAAALAPYNASLQLTLAEYDLQTAQTTQNRSLDASAWSAVQAADALAPWDPSIQTQAAVLAYELGQSATALQWANAAHQDGPFGNVAFRNLLGLTMWTSAAQLRTNPAAGRAALEQVLALYQEFKTKSQDVNLHLFPDSVLMTVDASMQVYVGTADYLLGRYSQSLQDISTLSKTDRDQAAVSLYEADRVLDDAALKRTGLIDQLLLKQIQANPGALQEYNYLKSI